MISIGSNPTKSSKFLSWLSQLAHVKRLKNIGASIGKPMKLHERRDITSSLLIKMTLMLRQKQTKKHTLKIGHFLSFK